MGIKYSKLKQKEIKVEAANHTFMHTKKLPLILTVDGRDFIIPVLIAKEKVESLLGRKGIFDHFDIIFQEQKKRVIFTKKS